MVALHLYVYITNFFIFRGKPSLHGSTERKKIDEGCIFDHREIVVKVAGSVADPGSEFFHSGSSVKKIQDPLQRI
jgi:hypothetical protein